MEPVGSLLRRERQAAGVTLEELARRAETSAPTLSNYERGRKEPRLSTVERILRAIDRRLTLTSEPVGGTAPLTRKDRQSLALHLRVAEKLLTDHDQVAGVARRNLERLYETHRSGRSDYYLDSWQDLLDGPLTSLLDVLTSTSQRARDLRQASPFAGVLTAEERDELLRAVD
jgi:transcriptional regulator with XRE-family HTH domain